MMLPVHWGWMLNHVQEGGFPEAIIAGGALRDLDNRKPIKDVDIFVRKPDNVEGSIKAMVEKAVGTTAAHVVIDFETGTGVGDDTETYDLHEMGVFAVYQFEWYATTFEIIVIAGPSVECDFEKWVIDDFDIGLCQIWWTGHGVPKTTLPYVVDLHNNSLTILKAPTDKALARTRERIARLLMKYPGYKVVEGWYNNEVAE